MTTLAVIGLGAMGLPMARHLAACGNAVLGVDGSAQARSRFEGACAPEDADLSGMEVVITMLPEGKHVRDTYTGLILDRAAAGTVLIDCSTIDVDTARELNRMAAQRSLPQIDAPVSGGPQAAGSGTLSFMVGGSDRDVARAWPVLELLGKKINHFGPPGAGQAAKACHNMICGITAMAVLEGFALAEAMNLDLGQFYTLCAGAAAQSWTLENRCPIPGIVPSAPSSNGFAPGFAAQLMAKDLRLAQAAARSSGQTTPFGALAANAFTDFADGADGGLDFSAYYRTLRTGAPCPQDD
ncbi:NAD(P)-binding domain-containing protein [Nitratireductor sp. StC3]|uniref:NAD(P)-dependent oxidoreductase n=1 Tax=Nitratireductor sp. StC3 TaxID=2126741 RepID=UPI000D0CFD72|nr:NAD(P)-binding domain-containing protein [Nitratireductor sp. StC3]PSM16389.1 3-hydroxyisobutyrate dehydrogenase [Nitratireductor sp. StC3]